MDNEQNSMAAEILVGNGKEQQLHTKVLARYGAERYRIIKKVGFERSRLGEHDLWQKVPSSPVIRNRLTRRFVRYTSDFISCKREHRRHETQL